MELMEEELRRLYVGYSTMSSLWNNVHGQETRQGGSAFAARMAGEYLDHANAVLGQARTLHLQWASSSERVSEILT